MFNKKETVGLVERPYLAMAAEVAEAGVQSLVAAGQVGRSAAVDMVVRFWHSPLFFYLCKVSVF